MIGSEKFHFNGNDLDIDVLAYWRWSSSDLLTNRQRGIVAEFIVASALGLTSKAREEWDAYDLITENGLKIEVKSSAYVQSWKQEKLSKISFGIQPTNIYEENARRINNKQRQADIYIFCVLAHQNETTINTLDLNQWDFYILDTNILNENLPNQKSITLSSLLKLKPIKSSYSQLLNNIKNSNINNDK